MTNLLLIKYGYIQPYKLIESGDRVRIFFRAISVWWSTEQNGPPSQGPEAQVLVCLQQAVMPEEDPVHFGDLIEPVQHQLHHLLEMPGRD